MSEETWKSLAIIVPPVSVLLGRVWSMFEHKKTSKEVNEIKIMINGNLDERIKNTVKEEITKQKKKT